MVRNRRLDEGRRSRVDVNLGSYVRMYIEGRFGRKPWTQIRLQLVSSTVVMTTTVPAAERMGAGRACREVY